MNPKRVNLLREAVLDLRAGKTFYESAESGLGNYFLSSLFSDLQSLRLYGGSHPIRFGYHRMLSRRFPYAIYYSADKAKDRLNVVAVLDMRRDPKKLARILSSRPAS